MPEFFSLPFPYADCAVLNFKHAEMAKQMAQKIAPALADEDLVVHVLAPREALIYSAPAAPPALLV